jgi:hypothetical protein
LAEKPEKVAVMIGELKPFKELMKYESTGKLTRFSILLRLLTGLCGWAWD